MANDAKSEIAALKPVRKLLVMDLLREAGVGVAHWAENFRGRYPSTNPKYCYNWSFEQPGELVAVCLWHNSLEIAGSDVVFRREPRAYIGNRDAPGAAQWQRRDFDFAKGLETAYRQQLPIRVIVVDGDRRSESDLKASHVDKRGLDPVPWAVTQFQEATGRCLLVRGMRPDKAAVESPDEEMSWFEGTRRSAFIQHRYREANLRRKKIAEGQSKNGGRLICEVPGCGFDFVHRYGTLGAGYAQVHHLLPLSSAPAKGRETKLSDLAIVCANCHAMIHKGGECRKLEGLIPGQ